MERETYWISESVWLSLPAGLRRAILKVLPHESVIRRYSTEVSDMLRDLGMYYLAEEFERVLQHKSGVPLRRNIAFGHRDPVTGKFHPWRHSPDYDPRRVGEPMRYKPSPRKRIQYVPFREYIEGEDEE